MATKAKKKPTKKTRKARAVHLGTIKPLDSAVPRRPPKIKPVIPAKITPANPPVNDQQWFRRLITRPRFTRAYLWFGLGILTASSVYWAVLGARLQNSNADQLVDPYLFTSTATLHGATLPGSHTFFLKWPLFWLVGHLGVTTTSLTIATVVVVLVTVLALAVMLYKIDRRPLRFGTICLFLGLMLLLVPAVPYSGALLPTNMAMLTTRNVEYIVYIAAVLFVVRARQFKSWYTLAAFVCLTSLITSDKLFVSLGLGSALLVMVVYALCRNWYLVRLGSIWFCTVLGSTVVASVLLASLQLAGVTHFENGTATSPYGLTGSAKDGALAVVYGLLGFLTNFGANPAYAANIVHDIPAKAVHGLTSLVGLSYIVAFIALCYGLFLAWQLVRRSLRESTTSTPKWSEASDVSLLLIGSTLAAIVSFVATKHYYAVDARYLAISVFSIFIAVATVLRRQKIKSEFLVIAGMVAVAGIACAGVSVKHTYSQNTAALASLRLRSVAVSQALEQHKVSVLVGDYWRVLPARFASQHSLRVMPFSGCTEPRVNLSSTAWQPDLHKTSFAYLLSLDTSLTDYPKCNLNQVITAYGRPNASLVIAGNLSSPQEQLLFYDHGIHQPAASSKLTTTIPSTVLPIDLADLSGATCNVPTVMTVVAHEDDDLLFTNPDLLHAIKSGYCVRTVFLTAGDSGSSKYYWLNRQLGSEAAYDTMLGKTDTWIQKIVRLAPNQYVTVASPKSNHKISLSFFNLPDGDIHGEGFSSSHHQSLGSLWNGRITTIGAVDGQSYYSSSQLVQALTSLMNVYKPAEIHTQADVPSKQYPDHSDHIATGHFAVKAVDMYNQIQFAGNVNIPVKRYIGYPVHAYPQNLFGEDLVQKEAAFLAYAQYDGGVCQSNEQCAETPTYGSYIGRQYLEDQ